MKVFRHPETFAIKRAGADNPVKLAALEKLGFEEITAEDIENDTGPTVVYEQVTQAQVPAEPPALPHLVQPVKTEELKTPDKVGDPVLVVTEQPKGK